MSAPRIKLKHRTELVIHYQERARECYVYAMKSRSPIIRRANMEAHARYSQYARYHLWSVLWQQKQSTDKRRVGRGWRV